MIKVSEDSLEDIHQSFDKWMELKDKKRIDCMLAVALSSQNKHLSPLWLIFIGASGDGKTEQIRALRDPKETQKEKEGNTKKISEITANTLVSGDPEAKDLAPVLEDKLLLIYDFSILLNLPSEQQRKVWAQLRELYDGEIGKQAGSGVDSDYSLDNPPSLIACSTPDIDQKILQHQKLGTRELSYRIGEKSTEEVDKVMDQVLANNDKKDRMRQELNNTVREFLENRDVETRELEESAAEKLKLQARRLAIMRAQGDFDSYSGKLTNEVTPEVPSRLLDQLKTLYLSLISLSDNYSQERALRVIDRVVGSSGEPKREKVFRLLREKGESTSYGIAKEMRISRKMIDRELQVLWNLGVVDRRVESDNDRILYSVNKSSNLMELFDIGSVRGEIKEVIEANDGGEGVSYSKVFNSCKSSQNRVEKGLEDLIDEGELHEIKPGKLQKL